MNTNLAYSSKRYSRRRRLTYRVINTRIVAKLRRRPCADCQRKHPWWRMDFDHVPERGPKMNSVMSLLYKSPKVFLAEVAKCDVICANCHRDREHGREIDGHTPVMVHSKTESKTKG